VAGCDAAPTAASAWHVALLFAGQGTDWGDCRTAPPLRRAKYTICGLLCGIERPSRYARAAISLQHGAGVATFAAARNAAP
jgi:hypothetical protein